jgi:hypothetical protein
VPTTRSVNGLFASSGCPWTLADGVRCVVWRDVPGGTQTRTWTVRSSFCGIDNVGFESRKENSRFSCDTRFNTVAGSAP